MQISNTKPSKSTQGSTFGLAKGDLERTQFILLSSLPALRTPIEQLDLSAKGILHFFQRRFYFYKQKPWGTTKWWTGSVTTEFTGK